MRRKSSNFGFLFSNNLLIITVYEQPDIIQKLQMVSTNLLNDVCTEKVYRKFTLQIFANHGG